MFPGRYAVLAPVFVVSVDRSLRRVEFEAALPITNTGPAVHTSEEEVRRYATREAIVRLHQQRFRAAVLGAYATHCAVCCLPEAALPQAAHIIADSDALGAATVVNGISLCAIHHLAYDCNLLGISPDGVVHIARRLLDEIDGPMPRARLQGFHRARILLPRRPGDRPDPVRLQLRFEGFRETA
jgi:putative restriction endonuclease